jgi:hypothetical protein
MKRLLAAACSTFAVFAATGSSIALDENSKKYDEIGQISDVALKAIEAAKPEFLKENAQPGAYTVGVTETDHIFAVGFCLKSQEQTVTIVRGSKEIAKWPRCPGSLVVELDKVTLKVLDKIHNMD